LTQKINADFTVKFNGFVGPENTPDCRIKQEFWHRLQILNYFAHGLTVDYLFLKDYFADHDLTVSNHGLADSDLNLHRSMDFSPPKLTS